MRVDRLACGFLFRTFSSQLFRTREWLDEAWFKKAQQNNVAFSLLFGRLCEKGVIGVVYMWPVSLVLQDWSDYDEHAGEAVGIYEVTHQFIKV